jgi:hypothetical protein
MAMRITVIQFGSEASVNMNAPAILCESLVYNLALKDGSGEPTDYLRATIEPIIDLLSIFFRNSLNRF